MASDIGVFFVTSCKADNDKNNKIRENILTILHDPPAEYLNNDQFGNMWKHMNLKWKEFLSSVCTQSYTSIKVTHKGGRTSNYDHEICFINDGNVIKKLNVEFKHNCNSIDKLPEYFNPPENKRFIEKSYAEFFYDNYIDQICQLSTLLIKPCKNDYMRYVYQADYSKHSFFQTLKSIEPDILGVKKNIVYESIKTYLETYGRDINTNLLTEEIKRTQRGKVFVLWNLTDFKLDSFNEDDFEIVRYVGIKNNNIVLVQAKSGVTHNLLLRWKNHSGILYPAWQISLER